MLEKLETEIPKYKSLYFQDKNRCFQKQTDSRDRVIKN